MSPDTPSPKVRTVKKCAPLYPLNTFTKDTAFHRFTWQPSGSQFTIIEKIPERRLSLRIKKLDFVDEEVILDAVHFDESWIDIVSI